MSFFELKYNGDDLILKNKYGIYSKKELEEQIKKGSLTIEELGDIYNLNPSKIHNVIRNLGISYRNNLNDTRVINSSIDSSMHQVLIGTLMGDGFMKNPKFYGLGHGINQYDYLYHVAERLHPFIASIGDKDTDCITKKSFYFWTYNHHAFIPYFNKFYSHGKQKKYFLIESAFDLDTEGLAYWYMDDGKYRETEDGTRVSICVGKITEKEGNILMTLLNNKFGLDCTFQLQDREKEYYNIYIKADSRQHFLNLISPYIIPSMRYKLGECKRPISTFDKKIISERHYELCKKAGRFIRYFGDKDTIEEILKYKYPDDFKKSYIDSIKEKINNKTQVSCTEQRQFVPESEELEDLLKEGKMDMEIASIYGVARDTIGKIRRKLGIKRQTCRITPEQEERLRKLFLQNGMTITIAMKEMGMSYYKIKDWLNPEISPPITKKKCHQKIMKEENLEEDLKKLNFNPLESPLSDYIFSKESFSEEIKNFLKSYEWLKSVGVSAKWCFTMRLNGCLAGLQILNEPTAYSKILGSDTMKWECLIQRGCTVSWAHEHLGSKMLMASIRWMVDNTEKRAFIGYSDPSAGEIGIIYQACNFIYLGDKFGVTSKYKHPIYKNGKEFCEHSLRRTSVLKEWCKNNGIVVEKSWIKPNGFKDLKVIPVEVKKAWYEWGDSIVKESKKINVDSKGKYILIKGKDKREQRKLLSLFNAKILPYPKRG